jgi:hypothetical protein
MAEQISFVQACQEFFSKQPHGRKIEVPEFKELSQHDKLELREMLIEQGYDVREFPPITDE